ncbi:TetR/AcrR family transcriptional regulator [Nocardia nova]|uniref:TetR/AcrR family transcriptional regulator n=1 Tax=Nocardia nova TaxID=37330 RepID=UPI0004AD4E41|nr:TetR/AcrR family transcriptional regulator [Nocardia nova]
MRSIEPETTAGETGRREQVLDAALLTFARFGYRKTSMDEVARAADISRPGLYFLFASKQDLFKAAATRALAGDIAAAERTLDETGRPLGERVIAAFDHWTGRYAGPLARDIAIVIESNPDLLGTVAGEYSRRFADLITTTLTAAAPGRAEVADDVAQTLLSTARGIKQQAGSRAEFRERMTVAVDLLLPALERAA